MLPTQIGLCRGGSWPRNAACTQERRRQIQTEADPEQEERGDSAGRIGQVQPPCDKDEAR